MTALRDFALSLGPTFRSYFIAMGVSVVLLIFGYAVYVATYHIEVAGFLAAAIAAVVASVMANNSNKWAYIFQQADRDTRGHFEESELAVLRRLAQVARENGTIAAFGRETDSYQTAERLSYLEKQFDAVLRSTESAKFEANNFREAEAKLKESLASALEAMNRVNAGLQTNYRLIFPIVMSLEKLQDFEATKRLSSDYLHLKKFSPEQHHLTWPYLLYIPSVGPEIRNKNDFEAVQNFSRVLNSIVRLAESKNNSEEAASIYRAILVLYFELYQSYERSKASHPE